MHNTTHNDDSNTTTANTSSITATMPHQSAHFPINLDARHVSNRVLPRDRSQTQRNHTAHATHLTLLSNNPPNYLNHPYSPQTGTTPDPPPLPLSHTARPSNPLIRFAITLCSQSHFHLLPHPTSHPPPSPFTPKPTPTLMKSHAAPNSTPKPLFYPAHTPSPLATPRDPKHSPDPFPPSPAPTDPHTPSNRMQLRFRV